ncbi:MAG: cysteine--tRNA ligase, partial [Oscillospiraceae bacterium]
MKIFNTLTRQKDEFVTIEKGKVKMYTCGPTVYNFIHIGNARPICVFDTLRKYLEYKGYDVNFVQNFTDIDDKLIKRAIEENTTVKEIADKYITEYITDASGLGAKEATTHPRATESVDLMIETISILITKGYAYEKDGNVYFRAKKFKEYGKLSHQPLEDLESGARINISDEKEDPMDFALWKSAKPDEPSWETPWGKGRPGWHIECSSMINRYLGNTIDLHCGGQDLIFPHHENEIAQSECCTGSPLANYWMHNGYLNIDNKKMSKSSGNFFTVRDVAEKYGYKPIRFMMLSAHYRSPLNYSKDVIEMAVNGLERLYNCRENMEFSLKNINIDTNETDEQAKKIATIRKEQFITAMDDDLNTADGISAIFELCRDINILLKKQCSKNTVKILLNLFDELT